MENDTNITDPLNRTAKKYFAVDYLFPYQRLVISNILEAAGAEGFTTEYTETPVTGKKEVYDSRPDQIVILPTGSGKSLCFMLPALFLDGVTIIVFPLLSLIADQARRLIESGINPGILRGGQSKQERETFWTGIKNGTVKFILTNPETVLRINILEKLQNYKISHIVIDEAHIVSEWGDTFRPVYLELNKLTCSFQGRTGAPVVTAFTATASDKILERIKEIIFPGKSPALIVTSPDRPNIHYQIIHTISKNRQLTDLLKGTENAACEYPVLIFSRSRSGSELTARMLRKKLGRNNIFFYHAGLEAEEKEKVQNWFYHSDNGILVATIAFGMGVDKKNIRTVIHTEPSGSVEAYLQESGRAGRDKKKSRAILIISKENLPETNSGKAVKQLSVSAIRYRNFILTITDNTQCRRKSLLKLMGAEYENCFGCDICDKTTQKEIPGRAEIISLIRKYNRKLTKRETVLILAGSRYSDVIEKKLFTVKGYGALSGWTLDEIDDAVCNLQTEGTIKIPNWGLYKNRLRMSRSFLRASSSGTTHCRAEKGGIPRAMDEVYE